MQIHQSVIADQQTRYRFWILCGVTFILLWLAWPLPKRHLAIFAVLIGVVGETIFDWDPERTLKARLKKGFAVILIVGLVWEIRDASTNDRKASEAEQKAMALESTNLFLRSKMVELEREFSWRIISQWQKQEFRKEIAKSQKGEIGITFISGDNESFSYAQDFSELLTSCGYKISNFGASVGDHVIGLAIEVTSTNSPLAASLQIALAKIGIQGDGRLGNKSSDVYLIVGSKPRPTTTK